MLEMYMKGNKAMTSEREREIKRQWYARKRVREGKTYIPKGERVILGMPAISSQHLPVAKAEQVSKEAVDIISQLTKNVDVITGISQLDINKVSLLMQDALEKGE
jgi:hypothetical protein